MTIKDLITTHDTEEPNTVTSFIYSTDLDQTESTDYTEQFGFSTYPIESTTFQRELTRHLLRRHGKRELIEEIEDCDTYADRMDLVRDICKDIYETNKYKYSSIARTMNLAYNPIENWYRIEHQTTILEKGEQIDGFTKGAETNTFTKGSQSNSSTKGEQIDTFAKGEQTSTFTKGEEEDSIEYGATSETTQYGAKTTSKDGSNDRTLTYGDITDINEYNKDGNKVTQVANGQRQRTDDIGARHRNADTVRSLGKSWDNNAGKFSSVGIQTDASGNYLLQPNTVETPNGDGNYNPAEREYNETVQNDSHYTDTHTDIAVTDTTTEQGYKDVLLKTHGNDTDNLDIDETVTEGQHSDTVTTLLHTDTNNSGEREDTTVDGQRTDTTTSGVRSDSSTEGQRVDTTQNGARSDTNVSGEREDSTTFDNDAHGNVGTLTTQQMIEQERNIANVNLVKIVATDILKQIAILVY